VTVLEFGNHVTQAFGVPDAPDVAFQYFARNEELLAQFLGPDRVEQLDDGVYRVKLNPHGALGLSLQPSFDVAFIEHAPNRVEMKSLRASLVESSHGDAGFDARFEGEAVFTESGDGTQVNCWASMSVSLTLPSVLAWMPKTPLEAIGNGIVQAAMQALSLRLVSIMQRDIRCWVARQAKLG
jgi:hypothetical protein